MELSKYVLHQILGKEYQTFFLLLGGKMFSTVADQKLHEFNHEGLNAWKRSFVGVPDIQAYLVALAQKHQELTARSEIPKRDSSKDKELVSKTNTVCFGIFYIKEGFTLVTVQ